MAVTGISANRLELLQIADAVAREKAIEREIVVEAIEVMAARPAIDAALAEATLAFGATTDDHAFAEQQRLTQERAATEQRLMALLEPGSDS